MRRMHLGVGDRFRSPLGEREIVEVLPEIDSVRWQWVWPDGFRTPNPPQGCLNETFSRWVQRSGAIRVQGA